MAVSKDDEIGALWERSSGAGNRFLSGKIKLPDGTEQEVVVFWNSHKQEGERTPDWRVYRSQPRDGGQQPMQSNGRGGYEPRRPPERPSQARREAAVASQAPSRGGANGLNERGGYPGLDDDIPF